MKYISKRLAIKITIIAVVCIVVFRPSQQELPLDRAYRLCRDCGLVDYEVDQLIENSTHSTLTAKEQVELWEQTAEPGVVELCKPCMEAVVEVAG